MRVSQPETSGRRGGESATPLLERERELEALGGAMDRLADGAGALLLVEGPAGIGKTRLLAEAAEFARRRKLLVRHARGGELERGMPFGVARQLFEPVVERSSEKERSRLLSGSAALALTALGRADPERSTPAGDPFAPIHGLYWLIANVADSQPVLLAVDDAHWADVQTLRFLDYLTRRLADLPVLVVVGVRSGEPDEPAQVERLRLEGERLQPGSLSEPAVRELIAAELGAEPSEEFSRACARATAGNPFLIAEVLRGLRTDAMDAGRDSAAAIASLGPESVARYALVRLGRFGAEAIVFARAIAVLGGSPQLRHAARLAGLEEGHARELCDRLREAEILTPGLPIGFVHPLVRQAIYRDLSEGERSERHRRAAEIMSSTGAGAREVVPHLLACSPNGDQWVVAQLGVAAWEAIRSGAYDSAQSYLERALAEPPEEELPLLYALGRCMLQTDPVRASEILTELAERASDRKMRLRALRYAAQAHFIAGEWGQAARCHAKLLEGLPESDREERLISEAELYLGQVGSSGRDDATSQRIESVASGLGATTAGECLARQALATDRFMRCAPVDEVVELAGSFPPEPSDTRTILSPGLSKVLARSGRWDEARRAISRFKESARSQGSLVGQAYFSAILADVDRLAGRLPDAEAEARTALDIAGAVATFLNPGREALVNLVAILIARGDLEEAARFAAGADLSAGVREVSVAPWPIEVRAYLRLARGELEAAVDDLLTFGEEAESFGCLNPALAPWRQEAAPALAALGRTGEAEELIAVGETRARVFGAPHVIGTVLRSKGLLKPRKAQVEILRESVAVLEESGPPHDLARSLTDFGAALRRDGRRSDAREPLRRGMELAHRCGAGGLERRAREELAATGARPRRAMITGRDALTATEQRIAGMAAKGMSSREIAQLLFVTPKTVENHLGRIYAKLGINSRKRLAEALAGDAPSSGEAAAK